MKKAVRPSSFAQEEIEYYVRWYESESSGLGDRLWDEIQAAVELISRYPLIGEAVRRTRRLVRRVPLRHFPFFLIYRERDDHLQIVGSCAHEPKAGLLALAPEAGVKRRGEHVRSKAKVGNFSLLAIDRNGE